MKLQRDPLASVKAALGCSVVFIFLVGILGFVLSFFVDNPELVASVRRRCLIGIGIGILMIAAWKIYKKYFSEMD
jgi:hypothetical protein